MNIGKGEKTTALPRENSRFFTNSDHFSETILLAAATCFFGKAKGNVRSYP